MNINKEKKKFKVETMRNNIKIYEVEKKNMRNGK